MLERFEVMRVSERRCRTKYGTIARVNWHRDGLVGITHLTDSPDGLKFEGLSNVYREDEVEFIDSPSSSTLLDVRHLETDELREQLLALRRLRRSAPQPKPRREKPHRDPVEELRQQLAALSPEEREALRAMLQSGGDART